MGLFDIFTGDPGKEAAEKQQQYIAQQQAQTNARLAQAETGGLASLRSGQQGAVGAVTAGTGTGRGDIIDSTGAGLNTLYGGQAQGAGALGAGQTGGLAALQGGVNQAIGAYDPYNQLLQQFAGQFQPTAQMSANALGLGGPQGTQAAQQAFQAGPGFQFALDQGLESVLRNANAAGMSAGGNALRESQQFGQGLAQQEYDKWRQALAAREGQYGGLASTAAGNIGQGVSQAALTGGTGAANIYTGTGGRLSDLYSQTGRTGADIYGQAGRSLAQLASGGGSTLANIYGQGGQSEANLMAQLAGAQANYSGQTLKPYGDALFGGAAAETAGSNSLWNAIGGLATFGASGGFNPASYGQLFGGKKA